MSDGSPRPLPDNVTMGLLPYLTAHALDEDYAVAATRRQTSADPRGRRRFGLSGMMALIIFAVLAITAGAQTSRNSTTDVRERRELTAQINSRKQSLDAAESEIRRLKQGNAKLNKSMLGGDAATRGVLGEIQLLSTRNGNIPVRGPGVRVMVDDAPGSAADPTHQVLDSDLQRLVNALWQAGAEAISVNGERLTNLTAIRVAGQAITVNFHSISKPYTVLAIGNPDTLPTRFGGTTSGQAWLDLQQRVGLKFRMEVDRSMRLSGVPTPTLRHASPIQPLERRTP